MKKFPYIFLFFQFCFPQDKGLESFKDQKYQESYSYYLNILKNRKNDISAKYGAGISAFKNDDTEIGMQYLKEASIADNDLIAGKAHFNLGNIYKDENKLEESIYHYKKAIELNSLDKDAKINFELVKNMLNQDKESNDGENTQKDKDNEEQNNQSDKNDGSKKGNEEQNNQSDKDNGSKESEEEQNNQNDKDDGSKEGDKEQNNQSLERDKKENSDYQTSNNNNTDDKLEEESKSLNDNKLNQKELSDKRIQADAILNALKDQEKINQKQKLLKVKSIRMEKDW